MNEGILKSKWRVFVWINILWIFGTIALGYIAFESDPPTGSTKLIEVAKIVFLSLGGLGVILPTYISAFNAIEARSTQVLENTFRLIEKWDDPMMFAARKFTRELKAEKSKLSDDDLVEKIENDQGLKQSIILVLNYFDQIRVSEKTGRIDAVLFNRSLGPVMQDYHHRFRPYVAKQGDKYLEDWDEVLALSKKIS